MRPKKSDMPVLVLGSIAGLSILVIAIQALTVGGGANFEQLAAIATACVAGIAGLVQSNRNDGE